ncbi:MAG: sulfite exporter TauE/SafE family protein [Deltaproteobacteria bacterium]|nr:sulfite exporter TauE/SafE family protein [Deltaproteobacteria bacterium]
MAPPPRGGVVRPRCGSTLAVTVHDPIVAHALLFVTGFLAGTINTVAGSGSLVTLPALMWSGLGARDANATNRVGVLVQNVAAVASYWRAGVMPGVLLLRLAIPSVIGAVGGSLLAATVGQRSMNVVIGAAMVFATLATLLYRPRKPRDEGNAKVAPEPVSTAEEPKRVERPPSAVAYVVLVGVGFYAGLVQVGLGLVILAVLPRLLDVDLVKANALKVGIVLVSQVIAIAVFTWHGQVDPVRAVALSAGSLIGGWLGARLAIDRGERFVRVVVVLAAVAGLIHVVLSLRG